MSLLTPLHAPTELLMTLSKGHNPVTLEPHWPSLKIASHNLKIETPFFQQLADLLLLLLILEDEDNTAFKIMTMFCLCLSGALTLTTEETEETLRRMVLHSNLPLKERPLLFVIRSRPSFLISICLWARTMRPPWKD